MPKKCDVCKIEIPEDSGNLLCMVHYQELEEANKKRAELQKERELSDEKFGIADPAYKENPEMEDKDQWKTNFVQFEKTGHVLWPLTRHMYEYIRDSFVERVKSHPQFPKFIWKPKVVDVGCGLGVGSNILSHESDFVWGIDKNKKSVDFATQAFARNKNNIYYTPQISFDCMDIITDERELMKFDVVVAIEIIEHVWDTKKFIEFLRRVSKRDKKGALVQGEQATITYISSPNRQSPTIRKDKPKNLWHVREWETKELIAYLGQWYETIEPLDVKGNPALPETDQSPILYRCLNPK